MNLQPDPNIVTNASLRRRWVALAVPYATFRIVGQATEFIGWVVIARRISTAAFGELSVAFLICRYCGIIGDWGASFRGARDIAQEAALSQTRAFIHRREQVTLVLSFAYLVIIVGIGRGSLFPIAAVIFSLGLSRDWIALGRESGTRSGLPTALQGVSLLVGSIVLPKNLLPLGVGLAYLLCLTISLSVNRLKELGGSGSRHTDNWMLVAVITNQLYTSFDTILLAVLRSSSQAGIYAAIYRIPNAVGAILVLLISTFTPIATRSVNQDPRNLERLRRRALGPSFLAGAAVMTLAPIAFFSVPVIFGKAYESGRYPVAILLVTAGMTTATAHLHPLFLSCGSDRAYALTMMTIACVSVIGYFIAIPVFGMVGAASATFVAQCTTYILLFRGVKALTVPPLSNRHD